jgi:hypothetical protein
MKTEDILNQNQLKVELADTPSKHEQGLMFRKELDENSGMLFKFQNPHKLSFWGLNTYIPLDIAFIDENNKIVKISNIPPLSQKSILSDKDCIMALETNYEYFKKNKINVGDIIKFNPLTEKIGIIQFEKDDQSKVLYSKEIILKKATLSKQAYTTKEHTVKFAKPGYGDGCRSQVELTENINGILLAARFMTDIYSFPLYEELWTYPKEEIKRSIKTFNKIVNIVEDMKTEVEDKNLPTPSIQGTAREELRYIDTERKKPVNNRSLQAARDLEGVEDWRQSLYGGRYAGPQINIDNKGTIYLTNNAIPHNNPIKKG